MPNLTPTSKRLIISGISLIGLLTTAGWIAGIVVSSDALLIINSILVGFFALLRGTE